MSEAKSETIIVPVDPACIPDGYEVVRVGFPMFSEVYSHRNSYGSYEIEACCDAGSYDPKLIIRKKYDPGIPLPKGWWVWERQKCSGIWVASPIPNEDDIKDDYISGIQHIPGFNPTPDGEPRQVM